MDQKKELEGLLSKHKAKGPEEGKLPEHPSYEAFLSALASRSDIEEMKKLVLCVWSGIKGRRNSLFTGSGTIGYTELTQHRITKT